jgi:hypothetical protein
MSRQAHERKLVEDLKSAPLHGRAELIEQEALESGAASIMPGTHFPGD